MTPSAVQARLGESLTGAIEQTTESVLFDIKRALHDEISRYTHEISRAAFEISRAVSEISRRRDEISAAEISVSSGASEISSVGIEISDRSKELSDGQNDDKRTKARRAKAGGREISSEISRRDEISQDEISQGVEISTGGGKPLNAKAVAAILRSNPALLKMRGKDLAAKFGVSPVVITRARKLAKP